MSCTFILWAVVFHQHEVSELSLLKEISPTKDALGFAQAGSILQTKTIIL